ncbi:hypothetical protein [Dactylosporangium sp. NPDC005555]|uniref:hypothetical protein n=1 Tax=Dactylosporangium sp. NPDC005555 TaxID=3154889 RepID=UPI00339E623F
MDPSKPNEPNIDQGRSIPRSRPSDDDVLEGEIIGKDEPLRRPDPAPGPPPKPPKRGLGFRKTLLLVIAVTALGLCLGGSITAYVLYDKATTPDRSTPRAAFEQYLDARVNGSTPERFNLLVCRSTNLRDFDSLVATIEAREKEFGTDIQINVVDTQINESAGGRATIETNIVMSFVKDSARQDQQRWHFELADEGGWRVCSARRIDS